MPEIPEIYVLSYNDNLRLEAQQKNCRFAPAVTTGKYTGKSASPVEFIEERAFAEKTSRHQTATLTESTYTRRWCEPTMFWDAAGIDKEDDLKVKTDPGSKIIQAQVAAGNRKKDDVIIDAFFAAAKTGETGSGSTSFPAGNVVAVDEGAAADTGLNVDKLKRARRLIMANDVDIDDPENQLWCAINAKLEEDLLSQVQVINTDYQDRAILSNDGGLKRWFGINFIHSERLNTDANADVEVPFWAKSGMHLGVWSELMGEIDKRTDMVSTIQMKATMMIGATRVEEDKVMKILCHPS